jgi:hypothetical protein
LTPQFFERESRPDFAAESGRRALLRWTGWLELVRSVLLLVAIMGIGLPTVSGQEHPSEYEVKAAFLFNFAKFVEWPPEAFPGTNSPIVLGVLGRNVFGNALEKTIRNRKVNNRSFQFQICNSAAEATNCQILFVSPSEKENFPKIVDTLHNASVLTVSEADGFIKAGGMVNFMIEGNNIRFQINDDAAKKARLKVSSKLLSLAAPVR